MIDHTDDSGILRARISIYANIINKVLAVNCENLVNNYT